MRINVVLFRPRDVPTASHGGLNRLKIQIIVYSTACNTAAIVLMPNEQFKMSQVMGIYVTPMLPSVFMNSFSESGSVWCLMIILQIFLFLICAFLGFFARRIILNRETLFISSVTLEDQGVYTCVASTSLDSVAAESQLIVLGKRMFFPGCKEPRAVRKAIAALLLLCGFWPVQLQTSLTQFHGGAMCLSLLTLSCATLVPPGVGVLTQTSHLYLIVVIPKTRQPFSSLQESPRSLPRLEGVRAC